MSFIKFMNHGSNETPVQDLIFEKNGRYVRFAEELTEHILRKRSSDNTFSLHQYVTVIGYENISDGAAITTGISKAISESIINWNFIIFEGNDQQEMPEVFKKIKPSTLFGAAEKAGIIPRSKTNGILYTILIMFAGFLAAGMIHLHNSAGPLSPLRLLEVFKNGWNSWNFTGLAITTGIAGWIILSVIRSYLKTRNPRLHDSIKERLRADAGAGTPDPAFVTAVKDRFLQLPLPMAILVTNPRRLDYFSKQVLRDILSDEECCTIGHIFWIIGDHGNETTCPVIYSPAETVIPTNKVDYRYRYVGCLPEGKSTLKNPFPRAA